ncbi:MAG: hypothetical protein WCO45_15505 [Pseudanabaena sp. ELA607]|jgi:hypothetical protein
MASSKSVKQYIAQWLQLGQGLDVPGQNRLMQQRSTVVGGNFSSAFEQLWQEITQPSLISQVHLHHTHETIEQLLSNEWEILPCARCNCLVACLSLGARQPKPCPCDVLHNFPNLDSLPPRLPVHTNNHLGQIRDRVMRVSSSPSHEGLPPTKTENVSSSIHEMTELRSLLNIIKQN